MSQTHRDGTAGALLWPNPLGAVVQNDVNHRPSYFLPASQDGSRAASWPRPESRWPSRFRLNSVHPTASPGTSPVGSMASHGARPAALPSLPCRCTSEARRRRGRLSLGRSPGASPDQTAWQHRLAAAFPRPRCPQRGSPVSQADFTELSVNARAARTKHGCSRTSLFVPLAVPPPY